jgi:hypothetical protein
MAKYKKGTLFVKISTFVRQNVGQTIGYGIGVAAEFVLQLIKMSSNQYRSCTTVNNGPGGI